MKQILVVDDEPIIRQLFCTLAQRVFPDAKVESAPTLAQAERMLQPLPRLVLIDLSLPDGNGSSLLRKLKQLDSTITAVVITSFDDDEHLFEALKAGADGYLLKDHSEAELQQMLAGIIHDTPPISPYIAKKVLAYFRTPPTQTETAETYSLRPRETETLLLIAKGLSVREAAELMGISHHTANGYLKDVYRKLNITSRAEATAEAIRLGIIRT